MEPCSYCPQHQIRSWTPSGSERWVFDLRYLRGTEFRTTYRIPFRQKQPPLECSKSNESQVCGRCLLHPADKRPKIKDPWWFGHVGRSSVGERCLNLGIFAITTLILNLRLSDSAKYYLRCLSELTWYARLLKLQLFVASAENAHPNGGSERRPQRKMKCILMTGEVGLTESVHCRGEIFVTSSDMGHERMAQLLRHNQASVFVSVL